MNVSVLGCGRWGSCIAWYLDKIGHNVLSCGLADAPEFIQLEKTHKNDYLTFPDSIEVSSDLEKAVGRAEVIVISISSQYLRSYFEDISKYNLDNKIIVSRSVFILIAFRKQAEKISSFGVVCEKNFIEKSNQSFVFLIISPAVI